MVAFSYRTSDSSQLPETALKSHEVPFEELRKHPSAEDSDSLLRTRSCG